MATLLEITTAVTYSVTYEDLLNSKKPKVLATGTEKEVVTAMEKHISKYYSSLHIDNNKDSVLLSKGEENHAEYKIQNTKE